MPQDFSTTSSTIHINSLNQRGIFNSSYGKLEHIHFNPAIQGGMYCLKGTRLTVPGIMEAIQQGHTIKEMVQALKKYWGWSISEEGLRQAIFEYESSIETYAKRKENQLMS